MAQSSYGMAQPADFGLDPTRDFSYRRLIWVKPYALDSRNGEPVRPSRPEPQAIARRALLPGAALDSIVNGSLTAESADLVTVLSP